MTSNFACESVAQAGLGEPVRRSGAEFLWRCPNHDDQHPSLSINPKKNTWMCGPCGQNGTAWQLAAFLSQHDPGNIPSVTAWLKEHGLLSENGNGGERKLIATYDYTDESGKLLFQVLRYEPKDFRQRRPDCNGGWIWNLEGVRRVLYRLPEALKAKSVLVCEGEKDCDTAAKMGLVATCNPHGAGKWKPEYTKSLRDKSVAIIADADEPGLKHARDVARSLVGAAARVRVIERLPDAKDLTDWVAAGGTKEVLLALIKATPELTQAEVDNWKAVAAGSQSTSGFCLKSLGQMMSEPEEKVSWLLDGILPAGGLSVLAAKPKAGKSTLARCLALAVAKGNKFLDRSTLQGSVIYLALEEKSSEVRKHFTDMGADGSEPIHIHCAAAPKDALPELSKVVQERKPVLIIVDPLLRLTRLKDANDYAQVSNALEPLMSLARKNSAHLLMVHHMSKGERVEATDSILGSTALFAAVDTALTMKRNDQNRTIQSRQRYGQDLPESVLEFNPECRWMSLGAEKSMVDASRVSEAILQYLEGCGEPKTEPEINSSVEGNNAAKRKAVRALVASQKLTRSGTGKKGDPFTYEKCSYACPQHIAGTSIQETKNRGEIRINTEPILVRNDSAKPFLAPDIQTNFSGVTNEPQAGSFPQIDSDSETESEEVYL